MLLVAAGPAAAQPAGPVAATPSVPDGQFTVGDPVQLTLAVTHPAGYQVILPQIAPAWGDFTVVSQSPQDDSQRRRHHYYGHHRHTLVSRARIV